MDQMYISSRKCLSDLCEQALCVTDCVHNHTYKTTTDRTIAYPADDITHGYPMDGHIAPATGSIGRSR